MDELAAFFAGLWLGLSADGGVALKRCTVACYYDREPVVCLYELAQSCGPLDECVESKSLRCKPVAVRIPWE